MKTILVTGGLGYIGSHTVVELLNEGYHVVIVDNLSNSHLFILERIKEITHKEPTFYQIDLKNKEDVRNVFSYQPIDGVIHFAAYKAVGESVDKPLDYYKNNLLSLIHLMEVMEEEQVKQLVFSSSAMVYGLPDEIPIPESLPVRPATNPYGNTKKIAEDIISDYGLVNPDFQGVILRYFNPVGAHESALLGELPEGIPNNLMPYITQTAAGIREQLTIFGDDYDTKDGTCIRDYIHVVDLAKAHIAALQFMESEREENIDIFNIGTGEGVSVKEMVETFEKENQVELNYTIGSRRPGDVPILQANPARANEKLNWEAKHGLKEMVKSSWAFQKKLEEKN